MCSTDWIPTIVSLVLHHVLADMPFQVGGRCEMGMGHVGESSGKGRLRGARRSVSLPPTQMHVLEYECPNRPSASGGLLRVTGVS